MKLVIHKCVLNNWTEFEEEKKKKKQMSFDFQYIDAQQGHGMRCKVLCQSSHCTFHKVFVYCSDCTFQKVICHILNCTFQKVFFYWSDFTLWKVIRHSSNCTFQVLCFGTPYIHFTVCFYFTVHTSHVTRDFVTV